MMRESTWSRIGTDVKEQTTLEAVLKTAGLDYEVEKRPIFVQNGPEQLEVIPNKFATTRATDNHVYGVVSDRFEMIQNYDAFDFVNYMNDELVFNRAGETRSGMVWIVADLPEVDILGDKFVPHVIFRNGFTGDYQITAAICPLRIVCKNQFNFAFGNTNNTVTIKHLSNAIGKLADAKEVLKTSADYMMQLNELAKQYANLPISEFGLERFLRELFPIPEGEEVSTITRNNMLKAREEFKAAHLAEDNRNFKGTGWGLINAYTDYITHKAPRGKVETRDEGKFVSVTFGQPMNRVLSIIDSVAI